MRVLALLGVATLFVIGAVGAIGYNFKRLHESFDWVQHTNELLGQLARTESAMLRAESGERGYVLTGDATYLATYRQAAVDTEHALEALRPLMADNDAQTGRLRDLRTLVMARLEEFRQLVALGPDHRDVVVDRLVAVRAKRLTELVHGQLRQMTAFEQNLLAERQRDVDRVAQQMTGLAVVLTLLGVAATAFGAFLLERQHAIARLHAANAHAHELQSELLHISRLSNLGEMASSMAHELNQPLAALGLYLQGARRLLDRGGEESLKMAKDGLKKATDQALRAGEVIRRLRDFLARGEVEPRVESLDGLVKEAVALARLATKDDSVRVEIDLDPAFDLVMVDKVQIHQVLLNLMRNGIEAMKDSEERILAISSRPADDGMVSVNIADTGSGIAPDVAQRLFQPFTTTKANGLGVGLSISRTIVESHGGKIEADANPGGGTVFRFTLRLVDRQLEAAAQ